MRHSAFLQHLKIFIYLPDLLHDVVVSFEVLLEKKKMTIILESDAAGVAVSHGNRFSFSNGIFKSN